MMIDAYTKDGALTTFDAPLSVEISDDLYAAGTLRCTVLVETVPADFVKARVTHDGWTLFCGPVDKQTFACSEAGRFLTLEARDYTALLLDNEAQPGLYETISMNDVYYNHIRRYGLERAISQNPRLQRQFTVTKGMSEFEVVEKFCRLAGLPRPFADEKGRLALRNYNDQTSLPKNGGTIFSAEKIIARYKPLSEILLSDPVTRAYSVSIRGTASPAKEVKRRRLRRMYTLTAGEQQEEARLLLSESLLGSRIYQVKVSGVDRAAVGAKTGFSFDGLAVRDLRIVEREIHYGTDGIYTLFRMYPAEDIC
ncbi:MAG: hypothetical protein ACOYKJ_08955 [Candidatus Howiella sp.]|jgi:hypothetical protein